MRLNQISRISFLRQRFRSGWWFQSPESAAGGIDVATHVMLFWCNVSRAVLRSSVVARLSMFLKRSMAEMFLWMLCLGRSSLDTNVSVPPSSQRNSIGQQSWPCGVQTRAHRLLRIPPSVDTAPTRTLRIAYRGYEAVL